MCEKCARYVRRHPPKTVPPGLIRCLANFIIRFAGQAPSIPLFEERAANLAVEAELWKIRRARTNRHIYRRKGRRVK